ncbi:MAG: hypothetical protein Q7U57_12885 [Methylovulum sp.]|nr:hypothetical protein [Methylovulum sp.]
MTEVFFQGYGSWFYEHEVRGNWFPRLFSVSPAGTTFILFPWDDEDRKNSFESMGFFNLTNEDAFAYSITKDSSLIKKLLPSPRYARQSTIQRMADKLEIGGLRVKEEGFYFLIDRNQPFILDFDFKDTDEPNKTETTLKAETITRKYDYSKLLMIIFGMAIDKYGHNPKNPKDTTYSEIGKRLKLQGIPVDKESIAMCLIEGERLYGIDAGTKVVKGVRIEIEQSDLIIIIYGMAVDGYGYSKEKTTRSLVTGSDKNASISGRFANPNHLKTPEHIYHIEISKGIVKDYLDQAQKLLPL